MDHRNCPIPSQVTWENNLSPLNEMHIHQENHWNDISFYWYQLYHWYQWTIGLMNRFRLCILDMCEFFVIFYMQMGSHCARHSPQRPWKLGLRIVMSSQPRIFCEESLGKTKFRAFPKCVGPRILSLESVDYFGTSEH